MSCDLLCGVELQALMTTAYFVVRLGCSVVSQALMAKEAVLKFNPGARIVAHHGNVKESHFGLPFVRSFDIVLNALDNVDARRYSYSQ